ncbi:MULTISPECIES: SDR family NAD(P)-dependent oxidoreductase [unclassified Natrinema]|uniref:SDR family NAD(P)-dependent oxidoreductase n=1 Tax=unclassified Natrinema TaxID=2622230 RepID=UPI00026D4A7F|nr:MULTISPECIES: SDR family NAD(P)-dependent oxidoreductase [unclassified Natrinema]AFO57116.1 short-chain dehydrogenase/reductase SDR [Natrinema sp. J7-2]
MRRVVVVAGVGPGLSASIVREFADHGWSVGLLARTTDTIDSLAREIEDDETAAVPVQADVTDPGDVERAFDEIRAELGAVDALVNHAATVYAGGVSDVTARQLEEMWRGCVFGAFLCVQAVVPNMRDRNDGTIIFTGADAGTRAREDAVGFSSAKFAVRGLAQGMAKELGPDGIHVAHVVLHGGMDTPRTRRAMPDIDHSSLLDPDEIATTYRHLADQPPRSRTTEVDIRSY